jgi:hypothetical protein
MNMFDKGERRAAIWAAFCLGCFVGLLLTAVLSPAWIIFGIVVVGGLVAVALVSF